MCCPSSSAASTGARRCARLKSSCSVCSMAAEAAESAAESTIGAPASRPRCASPPGASGPRRAFRWSITLAAVRVRVRVRLRVRVTVRARLGLGLGLGLGIEG